MNSSHNSFFQADKQLINFLIQIFEYVCIEEFNKRDIQTVTDFLNRGNGWILASA